MASQAIYQATTKVAIDEPEFVVPSNSQVYLLKKTGSIWYAEFQGQVGHIPERDLSDIHSVSSSTLFAGVVVYNFVPEESHEGALTVFADEPIYVLDATGPWWYSVIADEDSEERVGFIPANYAEPVKPSEVEEEIARLMRATRRRVAQSPDIPKIDIVSSLSSSSSGDRPISLSRSSGRSPDGSLTDREKQNIERRKAAMHGREAQLDQRLLAIQSRLDDIQRESSELLVRSKSSNAADGASAPQADLPAPTASEGSTAIQRKPSARPAGRTRQVPRGFAALRKVSRERARIQAQQPSPKSYENTTKLASAISRQVIQRSEDEQPPPQPPSEQPEEFVFDDDDDEDEGDYDDGEGFFVDEHGELVHTYDDHDDDDDDDHTRAQTTSVPGGVGHHGKKQKLVSKPIRSSSPTVMQSNGSDDLGGLGGLQDLPVAEGRHRQRVIVDTYNFDGALHRFMVEEHRVLAQRRAEEAAAAAVAAAAATSKASPVATRPAAPNQKTLAPPPQAGARAGRHDIPDGTEVMWHKPQVRDSITELVRGLRGWKGK